MPPGRRRALNRTNRVPCTSGGMLVFVQDPAQALMPSYVPVSDLVCIEDRWRQWPERAGIGDALMEPQLMTAGLHPPAHN
jgi:hypothetical protein